MLNVIKTENLIFMGTYKRENCQFTYLPIYIPFTTCYQNYFFAGCQLTKIDENVPS